MNYFVTFFTHSGAIKFSRLLNKKDIYNETSPVPRKISSNCGIGVSFTYKDDVEELYTEDIEKIYHVENDKYNLYKDFD